MSVIFCQTNETLVKRIDWIIFNKFTMMRVVTMSGTGKALKTSSSPTVPCALIWEGQERTPCGFCFLKSMATTNEIMVTINGE